MARLIVRTAGLAPSPRELKWGVTRVGRAPDSDILIEDLSVSARHCEIELGPDYVLVRDLGSTNGTFIDGRPIHESRIEPGQCLKLGQVEAFVERAVESVQVPAIQPELQPQTIALDDGTLSCIHHPDARAYWRCSHCQLMYCTPCIHEVRMVGGRSHRLCPKCSREVGLIVWDDNASKKKSIWDRIKGAWTKPAK